MRIAPVSADLLVKLALVAAAGLAVVYVVRQVKGAAGAAFGGIGSTFGDIGDTVGTWASDAAQRAWYGSPTAAADYAAMVEQATRNPGILPNYAINPYDLIPPGYTMNRYGDLVKNIESGGGGIFNGNGATGSW